jgi:hypothetical protein
MSINLEQQCTSMGLDPFRPTELITLPSTPTEKRPLDVPGSIEQMVKSRVLPDSNTKTLETHLKDLKPIIEKVKYWEDTWPFDLPRMILHMHVYRLESIQTVLTEYLRLQADKFVQRLDTAIEETPVQSGGQGSTLKQEPKEQFRHDQSRDGGHQ